MRRLDGQARATGLAMQDARRGDVEGQRLGKMKGHVHAYTYSTK